MASARNSGANSFESNGRSPPPPTCNAEIRPHVIRNWGTIHRYCKYAVMITPMRDWNYKPILTPNVLMDSHGWKRDNRNKG